MGGECISCVWAGFIISAICTFSIFDFGGGYNAVSWGYFHFGMK